jgi:hypothetical protein
MKTLLPALLAVSVSAAAQTERFETGSSGGELAGTYLYDPLTGSSQPNRGARKMAGPLSIPMKLGPSQSFTVEAFAKPEAELQTRQRDRLPVFKSAGEKAFFFAGIWRSAGGHSYNWWHGEASGVDLGRHSYGGISMVRGETRWRHLAFCYDAESRVGAFYLDYRLQASAPVPDADHWDLSTLEVGGGTGKMKAFPGWIGEVRITPEKLNPWQFLRATHQPLENISFAPEANPMLPSDYGHVDVRLHYGAVGDGMHDDTEAIRRAFAENENRVPIEYATVYFPAGTYRITDTIRFSRFMVVRGAGRERTRIVMDDGAAGFGDPENPRVVFAVGYDWPYLGRTKRQRAGNVIGNYLFDLTIDTGRGNPGAVALDFHCNNVGCAENIDLLSPDGGGLIGLDLKRGWPGPCLVKNVRIEGFGVGIDAAWREYSLVFSGIELKNQREVAIRNRGNILSLENVTSNNAAPAVENEGGGLVVLINSKLSGGDPAETAITSNNASLYLRNVKVGGYGRSLLETKTPKEGPQETLADFTGSVIGEHFTGPLDHAFPTGGEGSLQLEVRQTPEVPRPPVSDWINVLDFRDLVSGDDWAPAIQAAVDAGRPLVYFPAGAPYAIKSDVMIRGNVRTFFGGSPKTSIGNGSDDEPGKGPAFVLGEDVPVFQFDLLGTRHVRHHTATTLVFRHCGTGHVSAGPGSGDLFIENTGGKWRFGEHQRVWGRQLNPETKGVPEIVNDGGQLWVLGLKTEYLSTKIENRNGARTEILGGLMYPVHPVEDEDLPMFLNSDSDLSLVHAVSVYRKNHKIYCRDIWNGETRDFSEWHWVHGRPITNLYRSSR